MITSKQLENDLTAMEKQGFVARRGYQYNPRSGDPEQKYELTDAGNEKLWTYELEHLTDADRTKLERSGYEGTAEGLQRYIEETRQP